MNRELFISERRRKPDVGKNAFRDVTPTKGARCFKKLPPVISDYAGDRFDCVGNMLGLSRTL